MADSRAKQPMQMQAPEAAPRGLQPESPQLAEAEPAPENLYSEDGVDLSLIHWMLDLSPIERLEAAQDFADSVWMLRESDRET